GRRRRHRQVPRRPQEAGGDVPRGGRAAHRDRLERGPPSGGLGEPGPDRRAGAPRHAVPRLLMAAFLHLLKADSAAALAASVIESNLAEPGARVTVVLLDGATARPLPAGVTVRRLADGELDYPGLLDLI